ncbi:MAG: hypothetical protein U0905_08240 [Pirellulales bacterium]
MGLCQLIERIERRTPELDPPEVARLALLLSLQDPTLASFGTDEALEVALRNVQYRIQATSDQHAAVASELDNLASGDPCEFSPDHVWTLIRAIKVQSFILQMYLEPLPADCESPKGMK